MRIYCHSDLIPVIKTIHRPYHPEKSDKAHR